MMMAEMSENTAGIQTLSISYLLAAVTAQNVKGVVQTADFGQSKYTHVTARQQLMWVPPCL